MAAHERHVADVTTACRGKNGMEVLILVLALKCRYPNNVTVLRGNHETDFMTKAYGFHDECASRYSTYMYTAAIKTFQLMPLAAVVDNCIFAVHGGLSAKLTTLDDIRAIQRPLNVTPGTLICDLLWSDPTINKDCQGARQLWLCSLNRIFFRNACNVCATP